MASPKSSIKSARKNKAKVPAPSGTPKNKTAIWIGVLILFVVLAEAKFFKGPKQAGPFNVQIVGKFGGEDQPSGNLSISDIVLIENNRLAISGSDRLLIYDLKGKELGEVDQKEAGPPKFKELSNMSTDHQGHFYVMDAWNGLVRGFDRNGHPTLKFPVSKAYGPRGVGWDNGIFYVADTGTHEIKKLSGDGTLLAVWGHQGSENGAFNNPSAVVVDRQGNIFVADSDNKRVQELDPNGKFIRKFDVGQRVNNLAVDSQGRVYASSLEGDFVRVFDKDGKDLGNITELGNTDWIHSLKALTIAENGDIVAATRNTVFLLRPVTAGQAPAK